MKKHLAVILACVTAVAALAGCAMLYQTAMKHEAALQDATKTLDGVRSANAALKEEIAAAQKTLADLQIAREERAAALEAQRQKEQEKQETSGGQSSGSSQVGTPTPPPSGQGSGSNNGGMTAEEKAILDAWKNQAGGGSRDPSETIDATGEDWK